MNSSFITTQVYSFSAAAITDHHKSGKTAEIYSLIVLEAINQNQYDG